MVDTNNSKNTVAWRSGGSAKLGKFLCLLYLFATLNRHIAI